MVVDRALLATLVAEADSWAAARPGTARPLIETLMGLAGVVRRDTGDAEQVPSETTVAEIRAGFDTALAMLAPFVWDCPREIDLEIMQCAARDVLGEHDFTSFAASDPDLATPRAGGTTARREHMPQRSPHRCIHLDRTRWAVCLRGHGIGISPSHGAKPGRHLCRYRSRTPSCGLHSGPASGPGPLEGRANCTRARPFSDRRGVLMASSAPASAHQRIARLATLTAVHRAFHCRGLAPAPAAAPPLAARYARHSGAHRLGKPPAPRGFSSASLRWGWQTFISTARATRLPNCTPRSGPASPCIPAFGPHLDTVFPASL